jgi:tryptophan 2,3-dioxygenase
MNTESFPNAQKLCEDYFKLRDKLTASIGTYSLKIKSIENIRGKFNQPIDTEAKESYYGKALNHSCKLVSEFGETHYGNKYFTYMIEIDGDVLQTVFANDTELFERFLVQTIGVYRDRISKLQKQLNLETSKIKNLINSI